jgi:hypothetical protein
MVRPEYTRERVPLQWAMTQIYRGAALARLGERESGTRDLANLVEGPIRQFDAAVTDREPTIRIIDDGDPLAGCPACIFDALSKGHSNGRAE